MNNILQKNRTNSRGVSYLAQQSHRIIRVSKGMTDLSKNFAINKLRQIVDKVNTVEMDYYCYNSLPAGFQDLKCVVNFSNGIVMHRAYSNNTS